MFIVWFYLNFRKSLLRNMVLESQWRQIWSTQSTGVTKDDTGSKFIYLDLYLDWQTIHLSLLRLADYSSIWTFIKIGRLRKSEKTQNDYFLFAVLPAQTTSSASSPGDQPDLHHHHSHHHPHYRHLHPDVAQIPLVRVPSPFLFPASTMDLSASRRNKIWWIQSSVFWQHHQQNKLCHKRCKKGAAECNHNH